jgi:5'-3' exonuclease
MLTALVDADILAYQAAAFAETPIHWGEGLWTLHAFEESAEAHFEMSLANILATTQATDCVLAFSDSQNWRKEVLPTYKANRADVRKPMLLSHLRQYAEKKHTCFIRPQLEGDDVLGILATSPKLCKGDKVVCSIDKDFKTIPGKHYNFRTNEFFEITEEQADYWHLTQTLTGDATDGYSGCPGIGTVTAQKLLSKSPTWETVVQAYEKAGLCEDEALVQARVARICRAKDYNFKTKEVKLWMPRTDRSVETTTANA